MKYKCDVCGAEFDDPAFKKRFENLDGENGVERRMEEVCPICGLQHFSDITNTHEIVLRFRDFIHDRDRGPEEMRQLQDELDGFDFADYWLKH